MLCGNGLRLTGQIRYCCRVLDPWDNHVVGSGGFVTFRPLARLLILPGCSDFLVGSKRTNENLATPLLAHVAVCWLMPARRTSLEDDSVWCSVQIPT